MRKLRYLLPAVAVLLALGGLATSANAASAEECQATIDTLADQTAGARFSSQNADQDRAGLLAKLADARAKLADGKFADAIQKLTDFRTKVEALSLAGKIDPGDATALIATADAAIACIASLQATAMAT